MKKILIFSANDLFSHVLALELTKIGGIAERFEIKHNLKNPPQGYDLYVVDTALGGSRELAQSITRFEESSLILLSKSDYDDWQDFAESPRCVRLRRPFLMKDLRERAMQLLKSNSASRSGITTRRLTMRASGCGTISRGAGSSRSRCSSWRFSSCRSSITDSAPVAMRRRLPRASAPSRRARSCRPA